MPSSSKKYDPASSVNRTKSHTVLHCKEDRCESPNEELIGEEPLLVRVQGRAYSVVMRTPGEEIFHAAGFCLAEGLVDRPKDFETLGYCDDLDANVATVTLTPARRKEVGPLLERRGFVSQTSCGLCGKELIRDLCQVLSPSKDETRSNVNQLLACVDQLPRHQRLYGQTGSSHAAMICDSKLDLLAVSEDVGRHNALDKAIGKVFLEGNIHNAHIGVLSSRISYELIQKAARAHVPILVSMSRPTALAVELGRTLNMTLACRHKEGGLLVFCGEKRLDEGLSARPRDL